MLLEHCYILAKKTTQFLAEKQRWWLWSSFYGKFVKKALHSLGKLTWSRRSDLTICCHQKVEVLSYFPPEAVESCRLPFTTYGPLFTSLNNWNRMRIDFCWISELKLSWSWSCTKLQQGRKHNDLGKGRGYLMALFDRWKKKLELKEAWFGSGSFATVCKELRCYFSP